MFYNPLRLAIAHPLLVSVSRMVLEQKIHISLHDKQGQVSWAIHVTHCNGKLSNENLYIKLQAAILASWKTISMGLDPTSTVMRL